MNWNLLIIWIMIAFQSYVSTWQSSGTLRDVIWEYKHFFTYPDRDMCNMTQLLKSCRKIPSLQKAAVALQINVDVMRDSTIILYCDSSEDLRVYGCFLVECVDMPPRLWCRTFLPKCMVYGKIESQCYIDTSSLNVDTICTNKYIFFPDLCNETKSEGAGRIFKDFLFTVNFIEPIHQMPGEVLVKAYEGPLRPSNTMLFVIICIVIPFLVKFFLPNLWMFIAYALITMFKKKKGLTKTTPKKKCPPPTPFCWRRCALGLLLRLCEWLRRTACAPAPHGAPSCPSGPPALRGPCPPGWGVPAGPSPAHAAPLLKPRPPLFSRDTRIYAPPPVADVEYRVYQDSFFTCGCGGQMMMPTEAADAATAAEAPDVCLRPPGAVYQSREYARMRSLLAEYNSIRRGLRSEAQPQLPTVEWLGSPCVDARRLALTRTYLGNLQESYNCLQPYSLPEAPAACPCDVYSRMRRAQENLRRTLWNDIESAALRRARFCACADDELECDEESPHNGRFC